MKKLILTFIFCLLPISIFAQDYYCYIRTYDRFHIDVVQNKGRSKQGDIVEISRVKKDKDGNDRMPSDSELSEWAVYKVSGLLDNERGKYRDTWVENENTPSEVKKAYRKYKLILPLTTTGYKGKITSPVFKGKIRLKTNADLIAYERGRKLYALINPLYKLYRKFIEPFAYAAETISTINRTGETYGTITLWEDAKDGDITAGNAEMAECYDDDGDLSDAVTFLGWTTDADSYVKVIAPKVASVGGTNERHSGVVTSGFKSITPTAGNDNFTLQTGLDIYFEGLIIGVNHSTTAGAIGIRLATLTTNVDLFVSYCIFYDTNPSTGDNPRGIQITETEATIEIWNNIFYDFNDSDGVGGAGIVIDGNLTDVVTAYIYNNTAYGNDKGFWDTGESTTSTIKNNIANGNTIDYNGTFDTTNGFNVSEDTTSPDVAYRSKAVTFDNEAGDDFTVDDSPNDTLLDDGEDLSADGNIAFSDDIESAARTPWYIGASEGPAVSGAAPSGQIIWIR